MDVNYTDLVAELKQYCYEYHTLGESSISDQEYDLKFIKLLEMEALDPDNIDPTSPTQTVGSKISDTGISKVNRVPMLSLDNTYNIKDTFEFFSKIANSLGIEPKDLEILSEPKIDGLAIARKF